MAFSTILTGLQLGFGFLQSRSANRRAKEQLAQQREILDRQFERNMAFALTAMEKQDVENAYIREREILDRQAAELERERQLDLLAENQARIDEQRDYELTRQERADRDAKERQDFFRRQVADNQRIRQEERSFAEEFLRDARSRAAEERAEDLARFLENKEIRGEEREFYLGQLEKLQQQVDRERAEDMKIRDRVMGGARDLQERLERVAAGFGDVPEIPVLTREMIDAETARRQSEYQQDVDRAATAMASVGEADLIRRGLDLSTTGTERRGDITNRIADTYRTARNRAYDDAMKYITGMTSSMASNVGNIMDRRKRILAEEAGIGSAELGYLQNLPNVRSATDPIIRSLGAPTAGYDRAIRSADFTSPVGLDSAVYDAGNLPSSLGANLPISSGVYNQGFNIDSGIVGPYDLSLDSPASYLSAAGNAETNMTGLLKNEINRNRDTINSFSENLGDFTSKLGADLDTILSNQYDGNFSKMFAERPTWLGGTGGFSF